jgi:hypothetical protein
MPASMSTIRPWYTRDAHSFVVDNAHSSLLSARAIHQAQVVAGVQQWEVLDESAIIAGSRVAAGLDPFDSGKVRTYVLNLSS